jgi:hypothetical protein
MGQFVDEIIALIALGDDRHPKDETMVLCSIAPVADRATAASINAGPGALRIGAGVTPC